jgi:hypothetical protein
MYFDDRLPLPRLMLSNSKSCLGSMRCRRRRTLFRTENYDFTIRLTTFYDMDEGETQNILLHEMIHLYVNQVQPEVRPYRMQHGSLWTHTAKYATELYGHEIGPIEQYATDSETKSYRHAYMMKTTRTLVNTYLVKLVSGDLVPVKDLTDEQLTELTAMNIAGIYRVLPGIEQRPGTRVSRYIDWETLVDCIENGIDADTEAVCNPLRIRIGEDTETIWVRRHHK